MSDYIPVDWVDGVTPVNAANLDHMEAGIDTADALARAAIAQAIVDAKGDLIVATAADIVARLAVGTDGHVLTADAATATGLKWAAAAGGGGGGVDYKGAYNAGTAYVQGDVVLYNGVEYVCVNPGTGQTPPAVAGVAQAPLVITIGTSLPASPFDGQEAILVDSLTAPTYSWRFRYVASITDAYKWVFIGGTPNAGVEQIDVPTSSTTYVALGPVITMPRAGIYDCEYSCTVATGAAQGFNWKIGNYAGTVFGVTEHYQTTQSGNQYWAVYFRDRITLPSAVGTAGQLCGWTKTGGSSATYDERRLAAWPVRVA